MWLSCEREGLWCYVSQVQYLPHALVNQDFSPKCPGWLIELNWLGHPEFRTTVHFAVCRCKDVERCSTLLSPDAYIHIKVHYATLDWIVMSQADHYILRYTQLIPSAAMECTLLLMLWHGIEAFLYCRHRISDESSSGCTLYVSWCLHLHVRCSSSPCWVCCHRQSWIRQDKRHWLI